MHKVIKRIRFKNKGYYNNYEFYDIREDNEEGNEITEDFKIKKDEITIYATTTYKHFIIEDDILVGYTGDKPSGIIRFPKTILGIGERAFSECSNIKGLDLSQCTNLEKIKSGAFSGCKNAEIKLPKSIKVIEKEAFRLYISSKYEYCKKVLVPNDEIKNLVKTSGYPEYSIKIYTP